MGKFTTNEGETLASASDEPHNHLLKIKECQVSSSKVNRKKQLITSQGLHKLDTNISHLKKLEYALLGIL
jgi:hypothetical protein